MQNSSARLEKQRAHMEYPSSTSLTLNFRRRPSASSLISNDSKSGMKSPKSKDSAFEDGFDNVQSMSSLMPKIHGYLNVIIGKSSQLLGQSPQVKAGALHTSKKRWCSINPAGSMLLIYNSFSSQISNPESPSIQLPLAELKVFPTLLDGGDVVAFVLKSRTADLCLVAFSLSTKDTIAWTKSLSDCECIMQV